MSLSPSKGTLGYCYGALTAVSLSNLAKNRSLTWLGRLLTYSCVVGNLSGSLEKSAEVRPLRCLIFISRIIPL